MISLMKGLSPACGMMWKIVQRLNMSTSEKVIRQGRKSQENNTENSRGYAPFDDCMSCVWILIDDRLGGSTIIVSIIIHAKKLRPCQAVVAPRM